MVRKTAASIKYDDEEREKQMILADGLHHHG